MFKILYVADYGEKKKIPEENRVSRVRLLGGKMSIKKHFFFTVSGCFIYKKVFDLGFL